MAEIKFIELSCIRCGGQLKLVSENTYQCAACGKVFEKQVVTDVADQLRAVLNEQKQEAVANLRRQLWAAMHETYINSEKIIDLARDLKKYLPEDYFANFCEVANSGNDRQISQFLNNTPQSAMADYADIVLDFMLKSVTASNLNSISLFIERAFKGDTQSYDKYINRYEQEVQKVNSGIYELILTRDVFLAYSSADIEKVLELCDYLERNKISCFLALRNLRHGRGAVDNYDEALKTAIDNCRTVVFVSSTHSRDMTCDALIKELPYIKKKDFENAPAECKRNYYKIPSEYLMPRVQYLIEDYKNDGNVAEGIVDEFFHDLEWCRSKEEVARRVSAYLTETHETAAQRAERESREFQQQLEEERRKARELELRIAEAEAARVEAERRRQEEQEARQLEQQSRIEEERRKARELELRIAEAEAARVEAERRAAEQSQTVQGESRAAEDPNAKYCKKCRAANRKTAKFCSSCGSGEFFASFDEYLASKIKFCAECGAQNNVEDKFCAECGSTQFVPTKKAYEELVIKRAEEERQQKLRNNFVIHSGTAVKYNSIDVEVEIPNNVVRLGRELFCNCASIKSIIIPDSVKVIEDSAFKGCTSLTKLVIPESVCDIGAWAFDDCPNLNLVFENTDFGDKYLEEERKRREAEEEAERQRKLREEEERKRREEEERQRKLREEEERKRREEEERQRKIREEEERKRREEEERKRREEEERQRKIREEEERKRREEEERKRREEAEKNLKELPNLGDFKDLGNGYITFGAYPQSKKASDVQIGEIFDKERGYYLGSDNNLYAEWNGEYYKVEPIKWKVLKSGSELFIVSDLILDQHRFDGSSNNYANSEIRSWLNGEFYKKVFTESQRNLILTTKVDNSVSSTGYSTNQYVCDNTNDKIFLLSHKEAEQYYTSDTARQKKGTDYAKARGLWVNSKNGNSYWWLRSPFYNYSDSAQSVLISGSFYWYYVYYTRGGVFPALKFKP